jgi:3-isopropylmalate/(R)-2-methylmalate dehydratase small subunit
MPAGRAWVFGDRIDTDVLAPGALMKLPPDELARHCLGAVRPAFAAEVKPGDVVVAGPSFGIGSSREQAAVSLKVLGVSAVLAKSFARIFWRNAINLGLPALIFPQADEIADGDRLALDLAGGAIVNETQARSYAIAPLPPNVMEIVAAGGLMERLKTQIGRKGTS